MVPNNLCVVFCVKVSLFSFFYPASCHITDFRFCSAPALAVDGPSLPPQLHPENQLEEQQESQEQPTGLLDSILWMAAPKKRRTIEVNRTRRRSESKLIKVKVYRLWRFYVFSWKKKYFSGCCSKWLHSEVWAVSVIFLPQGESSGLDLHPSILHYGCSFISIILTSLVFRSVWLVLRVWCEASHHSFGYWPLSHGNVCFSCSFFQLTGCFRTIS